MSDKMDNQTVTVTVEIPVDMLRELIELTFHKVADEAAFQKLLASDKFKADLGADVLNTWCNYNDDGAPDWGVLLGLFGDTVVEDDEE
jgi:hypothetical protein